VKGTNRYLAELDSQLSTALIRVAENSISVMPDEATIVTLSDSSTVRESIILTHRKKRLAGVIIGESRPLLEGRKMARVLAEEGIRVTLVVDALLGAMCAEADLAIVGADSLLRDGSLVHKAGTYMLALSCFDQGKPFYVVSDTFKINQAATWQNPVAIEEKDPSEVAERSESPNMVVRNLYFDITPAKLITKIITEKGILDAADVMTVIPKIQSDSC
jgi:translation initiation factor eIF-2B subunit delta